MSPPADRVVRLHRGVLGRVLGGTRLHAILVVLLAIDLVVTVVVAALDLGPGLIALPCSLAILFVLSAVGFAARAGVESNGVYWRYAALRAFVWTDVEHVTFTAERRSFLGSGTRPALVIVAGGFRYTITPALGCAPKRLARFGRALAGFAVARGVQVEVTDPRWSQLGIADSDASPHRTTP